MATGPPRPSGRPAEVVWRRSHGGRLLHALPCEPGSPPRSGPALCGTPIQVDLRHPAATEPAGRSRCRRCVNLLASRRGELPQAEPGMLF